MLHILLPLLALTDTWTFKTPPSTNITTYCTTCFYPTTNTTVENICLGIQSMALSASDLVITSGNYIETCTRTASFPTTTFHINIQGNFPDTTDTCYLFFGSAIGLHDVIIVNSTIYSAGTLLYNIPTSDITIYMQMTYSAANSTLLISYWDGTYGY